MPIAREKAAAAVLKLFPARDIQEREDLQIPEEDIPKVHADEVRIAGERMKLGKAPGPDGVPPERSCSDGQRSSPT